MDASAMVILLTSSPSWLLRPSLTYFPPLPNAPFLRSFQGFLLQPCCPPCRLFGGSLILRLYCLPSSSNLPLAMRFATRPTTAPKYGEVPSWDTSLQSSVLSLEWVHPIPFLMPAGHTLFRLIPRRALLHHIMATSVEPSHGCNRFALM